MNERIRRIAEAVESGKRLQRPDAEEIYALDPESFAELLQAASHLRARFRGNTLKTCAIVNAKSGCCSEDCGFCAQSAHHRTRIETYPLLSPERILERAREEEVAVVMGAADGEEELAGSNAPGVDRGTLEAGTRLALEQIATRPFDGIPRQEGHAHEDRLESARLASTRSSKGSFSRPMIW